MPTDKPRITPEGLGPLKRSPDSLRQLTGQAEPEPETPPSQPGAPNPLNMAMAPPVTEETAVQPDEPPEIEFDWIHVNEWGHHSVETAHQLDLVRATSEVLRTMTEGAPRTRPVSPVYLKVIALLEDELRGERDDLARYVLGMHNLPLPEEPAGA